MDKRERGRKSRGEQERESVDVEPAHRRNTFIDKYKSRRYRACAPPQTRAQR